MTTPILRTSGPLAGTPRKEHGMGFSAPMVLANHRTEYPKRMTRRVATRHTCNKGDWAGGFTPKWKDIDLSKAIIMAGGGRIIAPYRFGPGDEDGAMWRIDCRYQVGDLIWQREAWWHYTHPHNKPDRVEYDAEDHGENNVMLTPLGLWQTRKRPSIHMPRVHSRSLYEITGMRAELVTGISEADAVKEGVPADANNGDNLDRPIDDDFWCLTCHGHGVHAALGDGYGVTEVECADCDTSVKLFRNLWQSINQKRGYPWAFAGVWSGIVWVIEYKPLVICGEVVA